MYGYGCKYGCLPAGRRYTGQASGSAAFNHHDPSGGAQGQATEIQIVADRIQYTKRMLNELLAANTHQPLEKIAADTERDYYMSAEEAKNYGLIDAVVTKRA